MKNENHIQTRSKSARTLARAAGSIARISILAYVGSVCVLAINQRNLIYRPTQISETEGIRIGESRGFQPWLTQSGEFVGWKHKSASGNRNAILLFHGNGGNALDREWLVDCLALFFDVHILEYPGYGFRKGNPSERQIHSAGESAFSLLAQSQTNGFFLAGESLGTGLACHVACKYPEQILGVLLITPFTELADVGHHHFPFLPIRILLRDRYDSMSKLAGYTGPVAFVVAAQDQIVPASLGVRLHDGFQGPKKLFIQPGSGHNDMDYSAENSIWRQAAEFLGHSQSAGNGRQPTGAP